MASIMATGSSSLFSSKIQKQQSLPPRAAYHVLFQNQNQNQNQNHRWSSRNDLKIKAKSGSNDIGDGDEKKKKFITRDQEPEEYWQSAGEREGENPMMTPLPYIIIFGMSTPFIILAVAFANGWIKAPALLIR